MAERVQEEAFRAVIAFASTGNPACREIPAWPACEPGKEHVLVLDGQTRVKENYDHELMKAQQKYAAEIERKMFESMGQIQH